MFLCEINSVLKTWAVNWKVLLCLGFDFGQLPSASWLVLVLAKPGAAWLILMRPGGTWHVLATPKRVLAGPGASRRDLVRSGAT